jgi:hypothetical protein
MKNRAKIKYLLIAIISLSLTHLSYAQSSIPKDTLSINFLGSSINIGIERQQVQYTVHKIKNQQEINYGSLITNISSLKQNIELIQKNYKLPDWLVYQLIRRIAEQVNSKYIDYTQYTLTKYLLLAITGFEPVIFTSNDKILLYIKSVDTVYNLPNKIISGKQYICLNYHDYGYQINFGQEKFIQKKINLPDTGRNFQYTIDYLPSFQKESYAVKNVSFQYKHKKESYSILVNPEIQDYFTNYPVTEYRYQFNIPFSEIAYNKLIPELKTKTKNLSIEEGVQYIMIFVRDGFEFETDTRLFGREKRLSAEETLVYNSSDCEDRSALFFLLVKELYNLPMAIISYPEHVNVAVQLPKQKGLTIDIENKKFTICEPTPQRKKRGIGWTPKEIRKQPFEIAYIYNQ